MASFPHLILAESSGSFGESLKSGWHFFETGGWFMAPIALCSVAAVGVIASHASERY